MIIWIESDIMKKYLLVNYHRKSGSDSPEQTVILEGDPRMTNQRMVHEFVCEFVDSAAEFTEETVFETQSEKYEISEVQNITEDEAKQEQAQNQYWVYQVNQNITDPASRCSYSGRVPGT